jgi:putative aldouronate transport system substrate-binding protein
MKKKLTRMLVCLLILVMAVSVITGCGTTTPTSSGTTTRSTTTAGSAATTAAPLAKYTITALFPGDTPVDFDEVIAKAEAEVKDSLNVALDFQFIPWADYGNKIMVKMIAGDSLDLHLNAPWLSMNQMISEGLIQPWDDLLDQYGADVLAAFPNKMIESNKFNDNIYGIPLGNVIAAAKSSLYAIRGDLRVKYGMDPIDSYEDLEAYFKKVLENEKSMVPATWNASQYTLFQSTDANFFSFGQNNVNVLIPFNDDGTVGEIVPIYEYDGFINIVRMMRNWYQEGIIDKDIMAQKDGKGAYLSGKAAYSNVDFVEESQLMANVPGAWMEKADVSPNSKPVSDFKMWNFLCLNTKCKDTERVTSWYNWIFADQAHYDLLQYGIKDKHWTDTGKGTYDVPADLTAASAYNFPGYVLLWNPIFDRISAKSSAGAIAENAFCKQESNYVQSSLTGFTPDYTVIASEIAQVSAIWAETIFTLYAGVVDPDVGLAQAKTRLEDAGYLKIVEAARKQINDYVAGR